MIDDTERLDDLVSAVNIRNEMLNYKLQYGSPIMTKSPVGVEYRTNENRRTQGLLLDPIWEQDGKVIIDNLKLELLGWRFDGTLEIEGLYDATGTAVDIESGTSMSLFTNGQFSGRVDVTAPSIPALAALAQNDYTIRYSMNMQFRRTVFSLNAKSLDWKGADDMQFATFQRPPEGDGRELVLSVRKPTEEAKDGALIKLNVREGYDETDEIAPGAALGSLLLSFSERRLNLFQLSAHPGIVHIIENENVQLGRVPAYPTNYLRIVPYVMETGENAKFFVSEDNRQPLHNALSNHKVLQDDAIVTTVTRGILNALLTKDVVEETLFPTITVDTNDVGITVRTNLGLTWTLNVRALETQSKFADYGKTPLVATEYYTNKDLDKKPEYASYMPIAISGAASLAADLAAAGHEDDFMTRVAAESANEAVNPGKTMSHAAQVASAMISVRKNAAGFTNLRDTAQQHYAAAKAGSSANDVWQTVAVGEMKDTRIASLDQLVQQGNALVAHEVLTQLYACHLSK
ncbi:hypothetical protein SPFM8_00212 [Salmonella phage SPFM8]|nr:hypothetical protein SPFM8_00212 [Salmonella phage SPFM8]